MKLFDLHADIGYDVMEESAKGNDHVVRDVHCKKFDQGELAYIAMASYFEGVESWEYMQKMVLQLKQQIIECEDLELVLTKDDLFDNSGKKKALLTIEGMCGIKTQPRESIKWLYDQGIRVASFCWNEENALATGVKGNPKRGLSEMGKEALKEMIDLNMIVDVSHANEKTFWDIMELDSGIVIATHSNVRELCDHPRNLWKEQLMAIKDHGGVVGVVSAPPFVSTHSEKQDIPHLVQHVRQLKEWIGIDHIAIGFDFMDFYDDADTYGAIETLSNATQAQNFVKELYAQDFSEDEIRKICYENARRVLSVAYEKNQ